MKVRNVDEFFIGAIWRRAWGGISTLSFEIDNPNFFMFIYFLAILILKKTDFFLYGVVNIFAESERKMML